MPYDEKRWKAALEAWRLRRWFERALSGETGYPQDRHLEEAEVAPEFPEPEPEPVLTLRPCSGCGVEYILTSFEVKYRLDYPPGLLCNDCRVTRWLRLAKGEERARIEAGLRAKAERRAQVEQRRAAAAKRRAILELAAVLRRIAARRQPPTPPA
jgi:hypothetical protein